jgi:hypothetical protein
MAMHGTRRPPGLKIEPNRPGSTRSYSTRSFFALSFLSTLTGGQI